MRLPTLYKLTSFSLYLSQLKHTLMSAMMSNKSCQRIKLNILLKTRVIWKFVFSKYLCGGLCRATIKAQRHCVEWGEDRGVSLVIMASPSPSQGRHALKVYRRSSELLFIKTCCVKAENFQDAADKKQHRIAESSWQCWWSVARPIIPESGAGWQ